MMDENVNSTSTRTLYDDVPYPSGLYAQTHPDRLATIATLFGMDPAPVEHCRVLELGCNDGTNLIAMAYALPESRFVGIDLAGKAIASGKNIIDELGLKNIVLRNLDLARLLTEQLGEFDYTIAHGLYSWVAENVQDRILAICDAHLANSGVAFVSYNTYPGSHFRDLTRAMMRYHAAKFASTEQKIAQSRALLRALAESKEQPEPYHQILQQELDRSRTRSDAALFHDDLSAINQPVYFYQFMEHAARHGLQYLSEASLRARQIGSYSTSAIAQLNKIEATDVIQKEQYIDFLAGRAFRQTLLCRKDLILDRSLNSERLYTLRFAGAIKAVSRNRDCRSITPEKFKGSTGAEIETDRPIIKSCLVELGTVWPQSVALNELERSTIDRLGLIHGEREKVLRELADALLQAHLAGHVEIHAHRARFVTKLSDYPEVSALARLQLCRNTAMSSLRHHSIEAVDVMSRNLIALLDGRHNRSALIKELAEWAHSAASRAALPAELEKSLEGLAQLGLLIG
jgi:methyltransferase-like protein/SAM-dependent methyltransferase